MTMDAALRALLTDTVTLAAYTSQDVYGSPTYASPQTVPARIEYKVRRVVDHTGQERVSRARVFLDGDVVLDLRDRVTLPDGTSPPILALYSVRDVDGSISHHEISF